MYRPDLALNNPAGPQLSIQRRPPHPPRPDAFPAWRHQIPGIWGQWEKRPTGTGAGEDGVNDTKKTTSGGNSEWTLSKWNMERGKRPLAPRLQTNVIERLAAVQERREWTEWSDRCVKRWPGTGLVREKCRAVSVSHKATLSQSRQTLQSSRRWNVSHL